MDKQIESAVKQLKQKGYRLSTIHWRNVKTAYEIKTAFGKTVVEVPVSMPLFEIRRQKLNSKLMAKGGYTTMRLANKNKDIEIQGISRCHENDVFDNKLAYVKAFSNLLSNARAAGIELE